VFTVTVQGQDIPFDARTNTDVFLFSRVPAAQTDTESFNFGNGSWDAYRKSANAVLSSQVRAVSIDYGGQYLDGTVATESALLAMLSVTTPAHSTGDAFSVNFSLTPNVSLFAYLPEWYSVQFRYTVELKRGSASIYRRITARVENNSASYTPMPPSGLPPLAIPPRSLTDTVVPQTAPVVNGASMTVYGGSLTLGRTPDFFHDASGLGHFRVLRINATTGAIGIVPEYFDQFLGRAVACEQSRYIFAPEGTEAGSPINYNYDHADEFIRSERCLQWASGGQTYERCIEPANVLCGLAPCDRQWLFPQTLTISQPHPCSLSTTTVAGMIDGCKYSWQGEYELGFGPRRYTLPLSSFYGDDLLYALEAGPVQNSISLSPVNYGGVPYAGTATLGGEPEPGISFFPLCPDGRLGHYSGKCHPASISVTGSPELGEFVGAADQNSGTSGAPEDVIEYAQSKAESLLSSWSSVSLLPSAITASSGTVGYGATRTVQGVSQSIASQATLDSCGNVSFDGIFTGGLTHFAEARISMSIGSQPADGNLRATSVVALFYLEDGQVQQPLTGALVTNYITVTVTKLDGFVLSRYSVGWRVAGSGSVSGPAQTASRAYATITGTPPSIDWRGGNVSYTYNPPPGMSAFLNQQIYDQSVSGTGAVTQRTDAIQSVKPVSVGLPSGGVIATPNGNRGLMPAVATIAQGFRLCGIMGFQSRFGTQTTLNTSTSFSAPAGGSVGLIAAVFEQTATCDPPFTATTEADWIKVQVNDDDRSVCVEVLPNLSGSSRSSFITFSPVWVFGGSPSDSVNATRGSFDYAITQAG
jgi:hypothetical protein